MSERMEMDKRLGTGVRSKAQIRDTSYISTETGNIYIQYI